MLRLELTVPLTPSVAYRVNLPIAQREEPAPYLLIRSPNGRLVRRPLLTEAR